MDWKQVAQLVAPFAPTVGRFLGDLVPFPGASIVGGLLGEAVAAALGVPATPDAVGNAIQTMPPGELQARLDAVEKSAASKYDAMARIAEADAEDRTAQSQAINETMRTEGKVSWWHWRHLLGYAVLAWITCPLPLVLYWMACGDITLMNAGVSALVSLIPLIGIGAALNGYVAGDTTRLKTVAMTGEPQPTVASAIAKAVLPVKKR